MQEPNKKKKSGIIPCKPHSVWSPLSASNLIWTNENLMSWRIAPMSINNSDRLTSALEMLRDWDTFPNLGSNVTQNILERRWSSSSQIINQLSAWWLSVGALTGFVGRLKIIFSSVWRNWRHNFWQSEDFYKSTTCEDWGITSSRKCDN